VVRYFIYSPSGKMIATMMAESWERAVRFATYKYGKEVTVKE